MSRDKLNIGHKYALALCAVAMFALGTNGGGVAYAQVPPPPPLPGQSDIATKLTEALSRKDTTAYASLLADDLQVYQDGQRIASSKSEWLASFGKKLSAQGVQFKTMDGYSSTGRILLIEYFNSLASWGQTPPPDCCWGYDAVAYDLADGKISKIQRLRGGDARLDDKGNLVAQ